VPSFAALSPLSHQVVPTHESSSPASSPSPHDEFFIITSPRRVRCRVASFPSPSPTSRRVLPTAESNIVTSLRRAQRRTESFPPASPLRPHRVLPLSLSFHHTASDVASSPSLHQAQRRAESFPPGSSLRRAEYDARFLHSSEFNIMSCPSYHRVECADFFARPSPMSHRVLPTAECNFAPSPSQPSPSASCRRVVCCAGYFPTPSSWILSLHRLPSHGYMLAGERYCLIPSSTGFSARRNLVSYSLIFPVSS
jgi:hypothetical protein